MRKTCACRFGLSRRSAVSSFEHFCIHYYYYITIAPPTAGPQAFAPPPSSSTHKDYFENLVTVLEGEKVFTLLPPTDAAFLRAPLCPVRRYQHCSAACQGLASSRACWSSAPEPGSQPIPWLAQGSAGEPFPRQASPVKVRLRKGETLYLPALWYHQVEVGEGQTGLTISVNAWFEMQFGLQHVAQQMLGGLAGALAGH